MVFLGCVKFLAGWVCASPSQAVFVRASAAADGDMVLRDGDGGPCLGADVAFFGVSVCSLRFWGVGAGMQGDGLLWELGNWGFGASGASPGTEGVRQGRESVFSRGAWACGGETDREV